MSRITSYEAQMFFERFERSLRYCSSVAAIGKGGSFAEGEQDEHSDLDIFVFCSDSELKVVTKAVQRCFLQQRPHISRVSGAFLVDGYGIGVRAFGLGFVIAEAFIVSEALWSAAPARQRTVLTFIRGTEEGEQWQKKIERATGRCNEYLSEYLVTHALVHYEKAIMYLIRDELRASAYYMRKVLRMEEALGHYIRGGKFLPEYLFKHSRRYSLSGYLDRESPKSAQDILETVEKCYESVLGHLQELGLEGVSRAFKEQRALHADKLFRIQALS